MKLKKILEEKTISTIKLAKASGKIIAGLNETKKSVELDKSKILLIASDIEKRVEGKKFELPDKENFSKKEVQSILDKHKYFIEKKPKKKKIPNIKKEIIILKALAEEKGILVIEGLSRKQLGKSIGLIFSTACISIIDLGRTENIFKEIEEENER